MQGRRRFLKVSLAASLAAAMVPLVVRSQTLTDEEKSAQKLANSDPSLAPDLLLSDAQMTWWRDAKFGIFVHWGLYAIPARGEWYMFNEKVPPEDYARLAQQFNPRNFDPDAWARLARDAGGRYMVMTARHHDGFSLWDSPASWGQFDSMHAAAGRDLVAPFVKAVRKAGLRVGLYYSPLDWRFPGYFKPKELPDNALLLKQQTWGQVEELMRDYGRIDVLWWDGGWLAHSGTDADAAWFWESDKLNRMVRSYQPNVVINPRSGWQGDFDTSEGGGVITGPIRARPWEKTFSLNAAWGYTPENNVMTWQAVVRLLDDAVVRNGNLLLNVGPDRDGAIPPKQTAVLRDIGVWMKRYGKAIYGTRPGPYQPVDGVYGATQRGNRIFLHVLDWKDGELVLPPIERKIVRVRNLSGRKVAWQVDGAGLRLSVPASDRDDPVTLIELVCAGT